MKCGRRVLLVFSAFAASFAAAHPGGTLGYGGVISSKDFDPFKELDYMNQAVNAGKFAWSKRIEAEQTGGALAPEDRAVRDATAYVPTFFTSTQNHQALTAARPAEPQQTFRTQRETEYTYPIYYSRV